jgi:hypothetical protein
MALVRYVEPGKTKHSVDLQYVDHAIDKKSQKLYLLAHNRLQLHEFHSVTGKFVQTIQTEEGYPRLT